VKRALARSWGRKVAILPNFGVLLVSTDLHGNLRDYLRLIDLYEHEEAMGNQPILVLTGDLVHGPHPDLNMPGAWPHYLGTPYVDESRALLTHFEVFTRTARAIALMGNHDHAHVGGPVVAKFHDDEAAVFDAALGHDRSRLCRFMSTFPLVAVAPCGAVLTHGAPYATAESLDAFERLDYAGYEDYSIQQMYSSDVVGGLLWARSARPHQAQALLAATRLDGDPNAFVAFGHDVVHEGYEVLGDEQICVSTSYGLQDENKTYLRLDLSERYRSVRDLRPGHEILSLHS